MPPTYHLLDALCLEGDDAADLIVAGDGVYSAVRCFGMSIPFPLVLCEIRGLPPLASLCFLDDSALDTPGDVSKEVPVPFAPSYHILTRPEVPVLDTSRIYQYVIASNGVFLFAGCTGIEVLMPISAACHLPGLIPVVPFVTWKYPLVDAEVVQELFDRARAAKDEQGRLVERLFYLTWEDKWRIHEPGQVQAATFVKATASSEADETAMIEGHSHHEMSAYFSRTDNRDELINGGFKVYFVLGHITSRPQIRTRVCVHGYSWEVPAGTFFALPADVEDCVANEWAERSR